MVMNRKYLIIILLVFLVSLTLVSAADNETPISKSSDETSLEQAGTDVKLEKTYYYDEYGDEYEDDTVVTHNVVKYYGDADTRFKVKVYDDDYNPLEGVEVSFRVDFGLYKNKLTDKNGNVYFALNQKPGKYYVETYIESEDGQAFWSTDNFVKIKSTIPTKELVKYSTSKKKFKVKFLDTKGHALSDKMVKFKINGKTYKVKTDQNGFASIKSTRYKVGKTKITAYNPVSKEKRKISVVVLKKGRHKINIRIDDPTDFFPTKKLKNGDYINTVYATEYRQYDPGVYVQCSSGGLENPKYTKLLKAKFYFKNKKTGKIITKTSTKVKYNEIVVKPVKGYSPYKATVWYKDKK